MTERNVPARPPRAGERRAKKLIVPDLQGMPYRDACVVLDQAGFVAPTLRYVEAYAADFQVVTQQPIRGQLIDSTVSVEVSVARQSWVRFLPQLFQNGADGGNQLLHEYLWIFEQLHDRIVGQIDRVPQLFRPLDTEPHFLHWLASWIALQLETDWPEEKKRHWLRYAPALYSIRGTRPALQALLEMYTGVRPEILENEWPFEPFRVGVSSEIGITSTILPPLNFAHTFVVRLPLPPGSLTDDQIVRIHRIVQAEKPAHCIYFLTFTQAEELVDLEPFMTIGEDALGADA
jgi:phage tail-like protein